MTKAKRPKLQAPAEIESVLDRILLELNSAILDAQDIGCGHCADYLGRAWSGTFDARACLQDAAKLPAEILDRRSVI